MYNLSYVVKVNRRNLSRGVEVIVQSLTVGLKKHGHQIFSRSIKASNFSLAMAKLGSY